jgi:hypothetical protein
MGAKGDMLAKQFEAKAQEATSAIEQLGEADWRKVTAAEQWPVGVVAHHIAASHATLVGLVKQLADGTLRAAIPMDALHAMNAKHAQDFANCTKAETVALHKANASAAAATLRGIADADYERSGPVLAGLPAMSAGQVAGILCKHVDEHLGSIKATVGA